MEIKITPLDIRHREFKRGLRGYAESEVDEFLDEVANEYERLYKAYQELTEKTEALDEKVAGYKRIEDALQKTLVSAQTSAEEVKQNASKAGQLMLHEAELKARQLMNAAYTDKQSVEQATAKLRSVERDFRFKFQQMLHGYLKQSEESSAEPRTEGEQTDAQAKLARHAEAIRAAIARENETASPAPPRAAPAPEKAPPRAEPAPQPAPKPEAPSDAALAAPSDEVPAAPAPHPSSGQGSGGGARAVFGEIDELLSDVDTGEIENDFKW